MKKSLKVLLVLSFLFFINTLYAYHTVNALCTTDRPCVITCSNNTDEPLEINNGATTQTIPPHSTMSVQQYIEKPSISECENYAYSHTRTVTGKLVNSGARFVQTYELACGIHKTGQVVTYNLLVGFPEFMTPPICLSGCDSSRAYNVVDGYHKKGDDGITYYEALKFVITKN